MNWVFTSLLLVTVGQTVVCGFSLPLLISYLGRLVFLLRCFGSIVPYKVSAGFEAAHLFFMFLGVVFSKSSVDWLNVIFTLLFCAIVCALYVVDDQFYLYIVGDDEDNKEEDGKE